MFVAAGPTTVIEPAICDRALPLIVSKAYTWFARVVPLSAFYFALTFAVFVLLALATTLL